jgi:DNA modification methylase
MILVGDVRQRLAVLPDNSVHCAVTSPPYFGLRDYGCDGQIGLEPTPDDYVAEMVKVFREVRRVLREDGTLWLNLGDSYAGGGNGSRDPERWPKQSRSAGSDLPQHVKAATGLANKQRLMIPARVALALQADGWWLRDEIIWHKPNPMPVSVTDRTTPAHEMLYMFSKSARYHYDMEAVKEPIAESSKKRYAQAKCLSGEQTGGEKQDAYEAAGIATGSRRPNEIVSSLARQHKQDGTGNRTYTGFNERYFAPDAEPLTLRQPRSVWQIATRPFKGAHFATFPPDLVRPCILAGCPAGGTVLDPFFGAGTTGLVAAELGRNAIGTELNPAYAAIAAERLGLRVLTPDGSIVGKVAA